MSEREDMEQAAYLAEWKERREKNPGCMTWLMVVGLLFIVLGAW